MPAQVARVGKPAPIADRSGPYSPTRSISIVIVVLSPPGSTIPSRPSRSSAVRTTRVRAPHACGARMCSANAPRLARTPMRGDLLFLPPLAGGRPGAAGEGSGAELPASGSEQLVLRDGGNLEPVHRLSQPRGDLGENLRLVEVGRGGNYCFGTLQGVLGLEDARAYEYAIDAQLHHQRGIGRGGDAAGGEVDDWEPTQALAFLEQLHRGSDQLRLVDQLGLVHALQLADAGVDGPRVADSLDHVAGTRLAFGADHGCAFRDAAQRLTKVPAAANKGDFEWVLVDVKLLIGGGQDLGLVDVIDAERLEDLRLDEVADAALRHHRDGDGLHDRANQCRVRHPGHAALFADVRRHPLESHHGASA